MLPKGKKVQLEALMNGLLLVAETTQPWRSRNTRPAPCRRFVRRMNLRAAELGLRCTRFARRTG